MEIDHKVLKALEDAGVKLLVAVPSESGTPDRLFSAEDIDCAARAVLGPKGVGHPFGCPPVVHLFC
jgi:hypothetical protein